ncbi:MAG: hypothetical protein F4Z31_07645 [Gemmatimonadetes bacterium]|nr:hypothetical protein [Gemmatimonadota bacterium]MYJ10064.1 hypothetical protein [Gemmatimonadota bacterium]
MPIKNYTTEIPVDRTIAELSSALAGKGVSMIQTMYGGAGQPAGLRFAIDTKDGTLTFAMPIKVDGVYAALVRDNVWPPRGRRTDENRRKHARAVAWRILHDWALAQLAIVDAEMAELQEIFLPYMLAGEGTLYRYLSDNGFQKALAAPE